MTRMRQPSDLRVCPGTSCQEWEGSEQARHRQRAAVAILEVGGVHDRAHQHARRREGRYLLRTNLADDDPARLWSAIAGPSRDRAAIRAWRSPASLRDAAARECAGSRSESAASRRFL